MDHTSVFDSADAMKRVDDDRELFAELIQVFAEELPSHKTKISGAISTQNRGELKASAHCIKGALGNLGAKRAWEVALRLEKSSVADEWPTLTIYFEALIREVEQFQTAATDFLKNG